MEFRLFSVTVKIRFSFLAMVALFLLLDENRIGVQVLLAAAIHEAGHLAAGLLFHAPVSRVDLSCVGIEIQKKATLSNSFGQEILIYLSGPLFNFIAAGVYWILSPTCGYLCKVMAAVHLVMGTFQLLPIGMLDGGMALKTALQASRFREKAEEISLTVSLIWLLFLSMLAFWLVGSGVGNLSLLFTLAYLAYQFFRSVVRPGSTRKEKKRGKK